MQTMQQQRAKFALVRVKAAANAPKTNQKEYKSYASALPFMIHANGLGQAAAFYRSKKKEEAKADGKEDTHFLLYKLLSDWLTGENQPFQKHNDLLDGITQEPMSVYLAAQAEAMVFMDWVKKFANAFMAESDKGHQS
ncbi:MAG: type III-B CRISPR module-associated protein Cmr5 [Candidatus Parabeggiatoa sp.]|nr:type III-B CRISPR module-associated protein Cmr5 [Candidatus Parabeggiatoa sp.]